MERLSHVPITVDQVLLAGLEGWRGRPHPHHASSPVARNVVLGDLVAGRQPDPGMVGDVFERLEQVLCRNGCPMTNGCRRRAMTRPLSAESA